MVVVLFFSFRFHCVGSSIIRLTSSTIEPVEYKVGAGKDAKTQLYNQMVKVFLNRDIRLGMQ